MQLLFCLWVGTTRVRQIFPRKWCSVSGSGPVAVVSDELWRNQFEADPHILGRVIRVGRTALTLLE